MKKRRRRHSKKARYALKIAGKRHNFRLKRAARKAAASARRSGRSVVAVPGHPTGLGHSKKRRSSKRRHSVRKNRHRRRRSVRRNVMYATANRHRRRSVRKNRHRRRSRRNR